MFFLLRESLKALAKEPPFRRFLQLCLSALPTSVRTKARWDLGPRTHYLLGVLTAADQARRETASPRYRSLNLGSRVGMDFLHSNIVPR